MPAARTGPALSAQQLGGPSTNRDIFELLTRHGWLPAPLLQPLAAMTGLRNVLVHGYTEVDLAVVEDVLAHHLGDLDAFVATIRRRLDPRELGCT